MKYFLNIQFNNTYVHLPAKLEMELTSEMLGQFFELYVFIILFRYLF